jgi:leucyl/phenylalanyl-tRNA---protein transferase
MPVFRFPKLMGVPPEQTPEGSVAIGGNLEPQNVLEAYRNGIFPWPISPPAEDLAPQESPHESDDNDENGESDEIEEYDETTPESDDLDDADSEYPLAWFSPHPRAILEFDQIHIPRSLKRSQNQGAYEFTINHAFDQVIQACQKTPRPGQNGTWITDEMQEAYHVLHRLGIAHSVEAWSIGEKGGKLVGGIYGVNVDGAFAGESMFHHAPNASKLALLHLASHLKSRGLAWMDIQMMTPHMKVLGAREISRDEFLLKLSQTRALGLKLF